MDDLDRIRGYFDTIQLLDGDGDLVLSSRPGRVAAEFPVDIPRPRRIESPPVGLLATQITARLRDEVARHGHR